MPPERRAPVRVTISSATRRAFVVLDPDTGDVMRLLSKDMSRRPQSALELKGKILNISDPLSAKLTPIPFTGKDPQLNHMSDESWDKRDFTPVLDSDHGEAGISIMWYVIPLSLFCMLIYFITKVF